MPELYKSSVRYFCDPETYRFETTVVIGKQEFREYIEDLSIGEYDRMSLLNSMITTNPYGGATHTPIADTLREYIGDWLEEYGFDSFHMEGKDFKYMFKAHDRLKGVDVSAILPKKEFFVLKLKYPKLFSTINIDNIK